MDTSSYHYRSRRPDQAGFEARIKAICETRVRYGYRRVHVLLEREGWRINIKKTHRIYNALGLQLRNKTPKRRVKAKLREDRCTVTRPNETWAMDFVHDQLATGRKIRVLTVVDTFSRYAPVLDPRFSYRAEDVVATLEQACATLGYPKTIRVDQGSEFVSRDLDLWAYTKGVTLDFSRPGKPTDNAFAEAFKGRVRAECLYARWFLTLADARGELEAWRDTTMRIARMGRSAISRGSRCKTPVAHPARHRDEGRKLHPQVLQRVDSDQRGSGQPSGGSASWWKEPYLNR